MKVVGSERFRLSSSLIDAMPRMNPQIVERIVSGCQVTLILWAAGAFVKLTVGQR